MDVFKEASVRVKEEVEPESGTEMDHQSEKWTGDCCPICEERFDERERILEHVEAVHKVVICILCGMTFDSADHLNDHKVCTGSIPFSKFAYAFILGFKSAPKVSVQPYQDVY